jgi:hypothetical protein
MIEYLWNYEGFTAYQSRIQGNNGNQMMPFQWTLFIGQFSIGCCRLYPSCILLHPFSIDYLDINVCSELEMVQGR